MAKISIFVKKIEEINISKNLLNYFYNITIIITMTTITTLINGLVGTATGMLVSFSISKFVGISFSQHRIFGGRITEGGVVVLIGAAIGLLLGICYEDIKKNPRVYD